MVLWFPKWDPNLTGMRLVYCKEEKHRIETCNEK